MRREETFEHFRHEWLMAIGEHIEAHSGWPLVSSVKDEAGTVS